MSKPCTYCGELQRMRTARIWRLYLSWGRSRHTGFHPYNFGNGLWFDIRWQPKWIEH